MREAAVSTTNHPLEHIGDSNMLEYVQPHGYCSAIQVLLRATKACSKALPYCTLARKTAHKCCCNFQLLDQSVVVDNLARETRERPHYPVSFAQLAGAKGTEKPVYF